MRTYSLYTLIICLLTTVSIQAQNLNLSETKVTVGKEIYPSLVADLEDVDADFARKSFSRFAKDKLDIKMHKHAKSGLIGKEIRLNQVYPERRADLVADVQEVGGNAKLAMAFVMGYDIILNSKDNPEEMEKFQSLASDIVLNIYEDFYDQQIKELNKELKVLSKKMQHNEKDSKKLTKKIHKNDKKVTEADEVALATLQAENLANQANIDANSQMNLKLKEGIQNLEAEIEKIQQKKKLLIKK